MEIMEWYACQGPGFLLLILAPSAEQADQWAKKALQVTHDGPGIVAPATPEQAQLALEEKAIYQAIEPAHDPGNVYLFVMPNGAANAEA